MAPTKQQKAFCAVEYAKITSVITVQRNFRRQFEVDPPDKNSIKRWHTQLMETGCLCKGKSTRRCLCVFHSTKFLLLFGGRHLEHFVPTGTAAISIITRRIQQQSVQLTPLSTHWAPRKKIKKGYNLFRTRCRLLHLYRCCRQPMYIHSDHRRPQHNLQIYNLQIKFSLRI